MKIKENLSVTRKAAFKIFIALIKTNEVTIQEGSKA